MSDQKLQPMTLPNDYTRTPEDHAAYMRQTGMHYLRYMENKAVELRAEAAELAQQADAEPDPKKAKKLREKAEKTVELAPLVERDGRTFHRVFEAAAERKLRESLDADIAQLDRASNMLRSIDELIARETPAPRQDGPAGPSLS